MRLHCHPLNRSELLNSPLFGHPHSDQCLCGYRQTGGASALRYNSLQDPRSLPLSGRHHYLSRHDFPIHRRCLVYNWAQVGAFCSSFPAPKPIRRVYSGRKPPKTRQTVSTLSSSLRSPILFSIATDSDSRFSYHQDCFRTDVQDLTDPDGAKAFRTTVDLYQD